MDETTRTIIDGVTVRHAAPVSVPGGHAVTTLYDCGRLTGSALARLAAEAAGHLAHDAFDVAVGVAFGGAFFATALAGGRRVGLLLLPEDVPGGRDAVVYGAPVAGMRVVVVDDVTCSGARLREAAARLRALGAVVVGCAVIVDRSDDPGVLDGLPVWSALQTSLE